DPVAGAGHPARAQSVGASQTRRVRALPGVFWMSPGEAGRAMAYTCTSRSRIRQRSQQRARARVRLSRIKERGAVVFFIGWSADVPAETIVDAQLAGRFPRITRENRPVGASGVNGGNSGEGSVAIVHRPQKKTGDGAAAIDAKEAGF